MYSDKQTLKSLIQEALIYTSRVNGNITINFDYNILSEGWWEGAGWKLFVDDKPVAGKVFMGRAYGSVSDHVTENLNVKGKTVLQYSLEQSIYCNAGDHYNTYYWIDNVVVNKFKK